MSRRAGLLLTGCAILLGTTAAPATADHHADAGYLVMTRAMDYPGTWTGCPYALSWGGGATLVLAGQEPGTYALSLGGYAEQCTLGGEHGDIWVYGAITGELTYARFGSNVGIGGWLDIDGHRHRVAASVLVAAPTSVLPSSTDAWSGPVLLR